MGKRQLQCDGSVFAPFSNSKTPTEQSQKEGTCAMVWGVGARIFENGGKETEKGGVFVFQVAPFPSSFF